MIYNTTMNANGKKTNTSGSEGSDTFLKDFDHKAAHVIERLKHNLASIAVDHATPQILHPIQVTLPDGSRSMISHIANIDVLSTTSLAVKPFDASDKALIGAIVKAVSTGPVPLNVYPEGSAVIVQLLSKTQEDKNKLAKGAVVFGEESKHVLRGLKESTTKSIKENLKSKDDQFRASEQIKTRIKELTDEIALLVKKKEAEILR